MIVLIFGNGLGRYTSMQNILYRQMEVLDGKKREHVVFDQMLKQKKSIPFSKINKEVAKKGKKM